MTETRKQKIFSVLQQHRDRAIFLAWSTGKDSTVLLDLVINVYLRHYESLPTLHILFSDTQMESYEKKSYVTGQLDDLRSFISQHNELPIQFHQVQPRSDRTFWVRVLGHGYKMPKVASNRWCTGYLKTEPMKAQRKRILAPLDTNTSLKLVGMRSDESVNRRETIENQLVDPANDLLQNSNLVTDLICAAIRNMTTTQVWDYIRAGLCYTEPDKVLASYGRLEGESVSQRSGCIFCPLIKRDKMLEEEASRYPGLVSLIKYRNYLVEFADPVNKYKLCSHRRHRGQYRFYHKIVKGRKVRTLECGNYTQRIRAHMLYVVLHAQKQVQKHYSDFEWITEQELKTIRKIWLENHFESEDLLPLIYRRVYGEFYDPFIEWEIGNAIHSSQTSQGRFAASKNAIDSANPDEDCFHQLRLAKKIRSLVQEIAFKKRGRFPALCEDLEDELIWTLKLIGNTDFRTERKYLSDNPPPILEGWELDEFASGQSQLTMNF